MQHIRSIIEKNLKDKGLTESVFASLLLARTNLIIIDFLGKKAEKYIRPKKFEKNVLYVEISSSIWAQEFQFMRYTILEKLREEFFHKTILDIAVKILGKEDLYDN